MLLSIWKSIKVVSLKLFPPKFGKSFKLTTLIDFQIDSNMLYNLKIAAFLAYGEAFSS
jgi:hypothetical protein